MELTPAATPGVASFSESVLSPATGLTPAPTSSVREEANSSGFVLLRPDQTDVDLIYSPKTGQQIDCHRSDNCQSVVSSTHCSTQPGPSVRNDATNAENNVESSEHMQTDRVRSHTPDDNNSVRETVMGTPAAFLMSNDVFIKQEPVEAEDLENWLQNFVATQSDRDGEAVHSGEDTDGTAEDVISLDELEDFARQFRMARIQYGFTQTDITHALGMYFGMDLFSQSTVSRFEALNLTFTNMCKLLPYLQKWLEHARDLATGMVEHVTRESMLETLKTAGRGDVDPAAILSKAEISTNLKPNQLLLKPRKNRTLIDNRTKQRLEQLFAVNANPQSCHLDQMGVLLNLERETVRVWFCNRRQRAKRGNRSGTPLAEPESESLAPHTSVTVDADQLMTDALNAASEQLLEEQRRESSLLEEVRAQEAAIIGKEQNTECDAHRWVLVKLASRVVPGGSAAGLTSSVGPETQAGVSTDEGDSSVGAAIPTETVPEAEPGPIEKMQLAEAGPEKMKKILYPEGKTRRTLIRPPVRRSRRRTSSAVAADKAQQVMAKRKRNDNN